MTLTTMNALHERVVTMFAGNCTTEEGTREGKRKSRLEKLRSNIFQAFAIAFLY